MIDLSKTYRTRDGREVKLFMTDGGGSFPIIGVYAVGNEWIANHWLVDGSCSTRTSNPYDLIEVKPRIKREAWVNVYADGVLSIYSRREVANMHDVTRLACIKITIDCEEGEGL